MRKPAGVARSRFMTPENTSQPSGDRPLNDPQELARFLVAYRPSGVSSDVWATVAAPATALVMKAGEPTRLRIEKDIQLLGAVVAHLVERGRPIALEEALADRTLLSFDTALRGSDKTRENKRGILRRLQSVHCGLPWRAERRADGARVDSIVSYTEVATMHRVVESARANSADDLDAAAFVSSVSATRVARATPGASFDVDAVTWNRARTFAQRRGWSVTRAILNSVVTHEVLGDHQPVAVLITAYSLTRRDLDLALTQVQDLPTAPSAATHDLLRGRPRL